MMGESVGNLLIETSNSTLTQLTVRCARSKCTLWPERSSACPSRHAHGQLATPTACAQTRRYAHLNFERILSAVKKMG